ncbi:MAG: folylpolyglutamate synthase/dihydrofolate synthase family protein [Chloroflexota bacterium]
MDYREAEQYVLSFTDYEKTPGIIYTSTTYDLRRMERLLGRLGDPHLAARSAHVAGTKGKGSTAAMIASVLTAAGYRTGLYTSPHFHTIRERVRVDGAMVSEEDFAALVDRIRPAVEAVNREGLHGELTTFEILTALAFAYFASRGVQYQALEVGLGGRLDATNVVRPEVCVITSISLDHTEVLGCRLEEIAAEKAGIIKPGCPVVSASQVDEVDQVLARACDARGAPLIRIGRDVLWQGQDFDAQGQRLRVVGRRGEHELTIPLLGEHQMENAACAVAALEVLVERGATVSKDCVVRGLSVVDWPGRLHVLRREPWLVCDGAHNADSAAKLRLALQRYFPFERAILVIGTSLDKDIGGMVRELVPLFHNVIVTRSQHPRSVPPSVLAAEFSKYGVESQVSETPPEAVSLAMSQAGPGDLVCVTGSLFVVGEVLASKA